MTCNWGESPQRAADRAESNSQRQLRHGDSPLINFSHMRLSWEIGQGNRIRKCGCLCTTRTTAVSAYGQREGAAPQGRTGRVVPVSQLTMYDVRFINNVRVAQIFFGSLTYAEIPLDPSL